MKQLFFTMRSVKATPQPAFRNIEQRQEVQSTPQPAPLVQIDDLQTTLNDLPPIMEKIKVSKVTPTSTDEEYESFIRASCFPLSEFVDRMKKIKVGSETFTF